MPYDNRLTPVTLIQAMSALAAAGHELVTSAQLVEATGSSLPALLKLNRCGKRFISG